MKKIFLILLGSVLLGSCTKGGSVAVTPVTGTTVDYEFSAPTKGTYVIVYTDSTGLANTAYVTLGTKWSKAFHPITPAGFKAAYTMSAVTDPTYTNPIGNLQILVGGVTKATVNYNFNVPAAATTINFILP